MKIGEIVDIYRIVLPVLSVGLSFWTTVLSLLQGAKNDTLQWRQWQRSAKIALCHTNLHLDGYST